MANIDNTTYDIRNAVQKREKNMRVKERWQRSGGEQILMLYAN